MTLKPNCYGPPSNMWPIFALISSTLFKANMDDGAFAVCQCCPFLSSFFFFFFFWAFLCWFEWFSIIPNLLLNILNFPWKRSENYKIMMSTQNIWIWEEDVNLALHNPPPPNKIIISLTSTFIDHASEWFFVVTLTNNYLPILVCLPPSARHPRHDLSPR